MAELHPQDLLWCVRRLPPPVRAALKLRPMVLMVAGGYIRACIAGESVSDIDIMASCKLVAEDAAKALVEVTKKKVHSSDNAYTVKTRPFPAQFIHRWTFDSPEEAIESFDFTIAKAAFWWNGEAWCSTIHPDFYADLAAKRLVYTSPVRIEEAGGSLLRVLKFYQRGYRIPLDSLGAVVARVVEAVNFNTLPPGLEHEAAVAKVITGLLREVDPAVDPDHIAHLPSLPDTQEPA